MVRSVNFIILTDAHSCWAIFQKLNTDLHGYLADKLFVFSLIGCSLADIQCMFAQCDQFGQRSAGFLHWHQGGISSSNV